VQGGWLLAATLAVDELGPFVYACCSLRAAASVSDLPHPIILRCWLLRSPAVFAAPLCAAALLREDATDEEVWAEMAPVARAAVTAARAQRNSLAAVRALMELRPVLPATTARELGITVLREDEAGNMAVGMFDVPALNQDITKPPKSE